MSTGVHVSILTGLLGPVQFALFWLVGWPMSTPSRLLAYASSGT
jgi:hypothetical protein